MRVLKATTTEYQSPRLHGDETLYEFTDSTVADIKHIILHSTSKTCALDPVPTSILKDNAETFAPLIMKIVNASLQSGTVPADMKHALVTPLHKRHGLDTNNLANYRPVSNIGFVSKVLERYVPNAVREHIDNNGYNCGIRHVTVPIATMILIANVRHIGLSNICVINLVYFKMQV